MTIKTMPPARVTDAIVIAIICFGWFSFSSIQAVSAGFPTIPYTESSFLSTAIVEIILATIAITFLYLRGFNTAQLVSFPSARGCLTGIVLYAVAVVLWWPLALIDTPSLTAAQPINEIVAGTQISFLTLLAFSVINGVYEETFLIGYLQRTFENVGAFLAIGITIFVRMIYHLYQGPAGTIFVITFGLVLSLYFLWKKNLWPVVFAHIFADFVGLLRL